LEDGTRQIVAPKTRSGVQLNDGGTRDRFPGKKVNHSRPARPREKFDSTAGLSDGAADEHVEALEAGSVRARAPHRLGGGG